MRGLTLKKPSDVRGPKHIESLEGSKHLHFQVPWHFEFPDWSCLNLLVLQKLLEAQNNPELQSSLGLQRFHISLRNNFKALGVTWGALKN